MTKKSIEEKKYQLLLKNAQVSAALFVEHAEKMIEKLEKQRRVLKPRGRAMTAFYREDLILYKKRERLFVKYSKDWSSFK